MKSGDNLNVDDIKLFNCGVISDLLEGKQPKKSGYISKDGLTEGEFSWIINEMIKERLIIYGVSANEGYNKKIVNWWNETEVTNKGRNFYHNFMNSL